MAHENIAEQTLVEQGMLKHITDGLQAAIAWEPGASDLARKLSTVRFITQSLQRHLDHLLALEEYDGYMDVVVNLSPHLGRQIDLLKQEHDQFREAARRIVHCLEHVSPTDQATFNNVCGELLALREKLDEHNRKETGLFQEAFGREGGGEG